MHHAAFNLDPYVRIAVGDQLVHSAVQTDTLNCLKQLARGDEVCAAALKKQLQLLIKGTGTYWESFIAGAKEGVEACRKQALKDLWENDPDSKGKNIVFEMLAVLKALPKGTSFCSGVAMHIFEHGWEQLDKELHSMFCGKVCDLLSLVGHTAGRERLGKGYGLVMTSSRTCLGENRLMMLCYVFFNWHLVNGVEFEKPTSFQDFLKGALGEEEAAELEVGVPLAH